MSKDHGRDIQSRLKTIRKMIVWVASGTVLILIAVLLLVEIDERVLATGTIWAEKDTRLHAAEDGILEKVFVREGTHVRANEAVVSIDATEHRQSLQTITASIEKARAEVALQKLRLERTLQVPLPAEFWNVREEMLSRKERSAQALSNLQRSTDLHEKGLISAQDLEMARLEWELSRIEETKIQERMEVLEGGLEDTIRNEAAAGYDTALAALHSLEVEKEIHLAAIERATLRAPEDGLVTLVTKTRPGQRVNRGDVLAHIAHGPPTRVELLAEESQFYRVKPGQKVLMRSPAFDPLRHGYIEGRVIRSALQSEPESENAESPAGQTPSFRVVAEIDVTPQPLILGSSVEAKILLRRVPIWRLLFPVASE